MSTITANEGYTLNSVKVTMGESDITASVYADGAITISSVTGNIVITTNATEESNAELLHSWNLAGDTGTNGDGKAIYNDLTNNFELIVTSATVTGNDRYTTTGSNFLLGKADSFTLEFTVTPLHNYTRTMLITGVNNSMSNWGQYKTPPFTKGRFRLTRGENNNIDIKATYVAVDKDSAETSWTFLDGADLTMAINQASTVKVTYDASTKVGNLYLNGNLVATMNDDMMIDGLHFGQSTEHMLFGEIKLYRGIK